MKQLFLGLAAFIVFSVFTSCQKEQSLEFTSPAKGSLQGAGGDCLPKTVAGTYASNKVLNDSNYIEVTVNVGAPGAYTITTDTVNGYSFKATGAFTGKGITTVRLKGVGTPVAAGVDDFTVVFDTTFCQVPVTVQGSGSGGNPSAGGDYFPLTQNSWWSYDDGFGPDSLKITNSGTATISGNTYQQFIRTDDGGPIDTFYFRKTSTGNYYESRSTEEFSAFVTFPQPRIDILFLKASLNNGDSWNNDYTVTVSGFPATARLKFTCLNNNESVTVNGKNFANVYHVKMEAEVIMAGTSVPAGITQEFHYAKGIGRILYDDFLMDEQNIRNWKVN